jgi:beta-galactosidase
MRYKILLASFVCGLSIMPGWAANRQDSMIDSDWRFQQGEVAGAQAADFNDTDWQSISIPHNWGWEQAQRGDPNYLRGPGWYRRALNIPRPAGGRRTFLRFEAAGSVADVYFNGRLLGQHRGAFGAFCYEITSDLSIVGTNVLAVRVSNKAEPDLAPLSGDFQVYGGLYRQVHLIETDEVCLTPTDHASPGVAWLETSVTADRALVDVNTEISNPTRQKGSLTLVARLLDNKGGEVAVQRLPITVGARQNEPFTTRITVNKPHLWNGRKDPYLYQAIVTLESTNGPGDSVTESIGLRSYKVDPDKGFFLNGQPYHLHGVDRHQDRPDKGWAISEADQDEDVQLLKEMGCTVVRCAHYEHSDYFYGLCDKAGILVWAEIPQVDKINPTPEFAETSRGQLQDLIRQNINHPAIFAWSLFNELREGSPDPHRELQDLNIVAHGEDPTRPTIAATLMVLQMDKIPDLLGWNIYPGWYDGWGTVSNFGPKLDAIRLTSKNGGFCISEYGAGANILQHEQNPKQPVPGGPWHPEEWQNILHENAWAQMKIRPWVWGTFAWNMFDFAVGTRHEGGMPGRNDKGLVTFDRATKKDAFYFYKANWSDEPMVYITSRRFTERTNAVTEVKVYSNAPKAELSLNGISLGQRQNDGNSVFVWKDVKLTAGENKVEARAVVKGKTINDSCIWTLKSP